MKNTCILFRSACTATALMAGLLGATSVWAAQSTNTPTTTPTTRPSTGTSSSSGTMSPSSSSSSATTPSTSSTNRPATSSSQSISGTLQSADRSFLETAAKDGMAEVHISELAVQRATNPQVRSFAQQLVTDHQRANTDLMALAQRKGVSLALATSGGVGAQTRMGSPSDYSATSSSAGTGNSTTGTGTSANTTDRTSGMSSPSSSGTTGSTGSSTGTTGTTGSSTGASSSTDNSRAATSGTTGASSSTSGTSSNSMNSGASSTQSGSMSSSMDRDLQEKVQDLSRKQGNEFDSAYIRQMVDDHKQTIDQFEDAAERNSDGDVAAFANKQLPTLREHYRRAQEIARTIER